MPLETELLALSRDCTPYGYCESYAGARNPLAQLLLLPAFLWFETSLSVVSFQLPDLTSLPDCNTLEITLTLRSPGHPRRSIGQRENSLL